MHPRLMRLHFASGAILLILLCACLFQYFPYHGTIESMKKLLISLTEPEYEALRRYAFDNNLSKAEVVRRAIDALCGIEHQPVGRWANRETAKESE